MGIRAYKKERIIWGLSVSGVLGALFWAAGKAVGGVLPRHPFQGSPGPKQLVELQLALTL